MANLILEFVYYESKVFLTSGGDCEVAIGRGGVDDGGPALGEAGRVEVGGGGEHGHAGADKHARDDQQVTSLEAKQEEAAPDLTA